MKKYFTIFLVSFLVFFSILGGVYYYINKTHSNMLEEEYHEAIEENPDLKPPEVTKDDIIINTLVLGVNQGLSDIMMVASYNKQNNKIAVVSIPRDTRINSKYHQGKINEAHNTEEGAALSMKIVSDLLNIPIHHYVKIDLKGAKKIIDIMGGVKMYVPMDMDYEDPYQDLYIHLKEGEQVLDGDKAVQFIRFREGYPDQDLGRIRAQQAFLKAVVDKLTSPAILPKAVSLVNTMSKNVNTDMATDEIAFFASKINDIRIDNIKMFTVEGKAVRIQGKEYLLHDQEKLEAMMKEVEASLEIEQSIATAQMEVNNNFQQKDTQNNTPAINKKDIKIEILNSTKTNGLAAGIKKQLEERGYTVVRIGDTKDLTLASSRIINRRGAEDKLNQVILDTEIIQIDTDVDDTYDCDITIVLGKDMIKN